MSNKTSDENVGNIEDDIKKYVKRCEELAKPEHANWIGISNQLAILHMLEDYKMQKQINEEHRKLNGELRKKVKELEEENHIQRKQLNDVFDRGFISKQVVIDIIDENGFEVYTREYGNVEVVSIDALQEFLETK